VPYVVKIISMPSTSRVSESQGVRWFGWCRSWIPKNTRVKVRVGIFYPTQTPEVELNQFYIALLS